MADLVLRTDVDGVAIVELNRPERRNAMTGPTFDALAETIAGADADKSVDAIVFCGAGGAFCSGIDLDDYRADPPPVWIETAASSSLAAHRALASARAPIVVALERFAINAGASLAMAGDLLVVGEQAWLQVMEAKMGMAAPMNVAWLVAKYPLATVMRVVLTGDRFSGPELAAMGIAHDVVADDAVRSRAIELAVTMAGYPDGAAAQMKASVLRVAAASPTAPAEWLERAGELARWSRP